MDKQEEFINLEIKLRKNCAPDLNHHVYLNIIHPKENFLQIKRGETVIRTIREEDEDILWHAGIVVLKGIEKDARKEQ